MDRYFYRLNCAATVLAASLLIASPAPAAFYLFSGNSSDGHAVSGSANFTLGAGTVTVQLTNTTTTTLDAGELFSGIDFSFGGLVPTLATATGIQRTVGSNGSFTDTGIAQNLSWSLESLGSGLFQLNFNPNAKDSIIGPPTAGSYSGANGSIKDNNGHNPFAAQTATFVLDVPGLNANSPLNVSTFRYGTTLAPATGTITSTPEPATWMVWGGILAAAAVAFGYRRCAGGNCL